MKENIYSRVVRMPGWELFRRQAPKYIDQILPPSIKKMLAVEAGSSLGWYEWTGNVVNIVAADKFGSSPTYKKLY